MGIEYEVEFGVDKAIANIKKIKSAMDDIQGASSLSGGVSSLLGLGKGGTLGAGLAGGALAAGAGYAQLAGFGQIPGIMSDVFFNNTIAATRRISNNRTAEQQVIDIFGPAGKDATREELEFHFKANKEILDLQSDSEASVRDKLADIKLKNISKTATDELPEALVSDAMDFFSDAKVFFDFVKSMLDRIIERLGWLF